MRQDEIIHMAREAGFVIYDNERRSVEGEAENFERFAALVAANEREKQAEQEPVAWMVYTADGQSVYVTDNPTDIKIGQRALPLYTAAQTDMNLSCKSVQARLATSWGYVKAEQAEQEPVTLPCCGYHDASAIMWNKFNGVVQCHNCGQLYAAPVRTKDLTDDEIRAMFNGYVAPEILLMFRAVIAADREKNK